MDEEALNHDQVTQESHAGSPWLAAIAAGDERAFTQLVHQYSGPVFRFLQRMLNSKADAEDLTQEAFCEIYKHRGTLRVDVEIAPYLFTIAKRKAISFLRWRKVRSILSPLREVHEQTLAGRGEHARERLQQNRREALVEAALARLKPEKRAVLILRFFEEMNYNEIAEIMSRPVATVRSLAFRAERELRRRLQQEPEWGES